MTWAIRFDNVSKQYTLGGARARRAITLRHELSTLGRRLFGLKGPVPFSYTETRALQGVSFEIPAGQACAIIGPNGAGKTTLLRLVSRISHPTEGRVAVRGRVGALIEVGAGLHPELSGRENIWLFGRILGMSRQDITRRFDDIINFAEIGHDLDKPVKHYSSGMQLRLGFAIASHVDPDIFVVDEALAVGDASFQAKCVERMMMLVNQGRTLLFVSHDLTAIDATCSQAIFILDGKVQMYGPTREAIHTYLQWVDRHHEDDLERAVPSRADRPLRVERVTLRREDGREDSVLRTGETVEIALTVDIGVPIERPVFTLGISDGRPGALIICPMTVGRAGPALFGRAEVICRINALPLLPRVYQIWCSVRSESWPGEILDRQTIGAFRVTEGPTRDRLSAYPSHDAPVHVDYEWRW